MAEGVPGWLDETFLVTSLRGGKYSDNQTKIIQFSAKPAVAAGENYMSHLYRVHVTYKNQESEEQSTSLIIKEPITEGVITEAFGDIDMYAIEPKIYSALLPKMNKQVGFEFGPKSFYCPLEKGLVLQDLKNDGFILCNQYNQLDYPHCKYTLTVLAKFHAASVACYHDDPQLVASVGSERVFVEGGPLTNVMSVWIRAAMETVAEIINGKDDCKPAAKLIRSKVDGIVQSLIKIFSPKENGLNVLNHGDLWINNLLFKHNTSEDVIDMKLIDFQLTRYGSPALDLLHFIWTSANENVRENRLHDLYEIYLKTLNTTLEELGCQERISSEELDQDLKSALDWAIVNICYDLPMLVCDKEDAVNLEEVNSEDLKSGGDDRFHKLYEGKHFNTLIFNLMKQFYAWAS